MALVITINTVILRVYPCPPPYFTLRPVEVSPIEFPEMPDTILVSHVILRVVMTMTIEIIMLDWLSCLPYKF